MREIDHDRGEDDKRLAAESVTEAVGYVVGNPHASLLTPLGTPGIDEQEGPGAVVVAGDRHGMVAVGLVGAPKPFALAVQVRRVDAVAGGIENGIGTDTDADNVTAGEGGADVIAMAEHKGGGIAKGGSFAMGLRGGLSAEIAGQVGRLREGRRTAAFEQEEERLRVAARILAAVDLVVEVGGRKDLGRRAGTPTLVAGLEIGLRVVAEGPGGAVVHRLLADGRQPIAEINLGRTGTRRRLVKVTADGCQLSLGVRREPLGSEIRRDQGKRDAANQNSGEVCGHRETFDTFRNWVVSRQVARSSRSHGDA